MATPSRSESVDEAEPNALSAAREEIDCTDWPDQAFASRSDLRRSEDAVLCLFVLFREGFRGES